jgi:acyl-CoA thioesterase FadM
VLSHLVRTLPALLRARMGADGRLVSRLRRRVGLGEIDFNGHMNQAAYLQVMELGRVDWLIRSRGWRHFEGLGIKPVVASQSITYRRELKPRQAYLMDTRAVGLDGRLLVFETYLIVGGRVHAKGEAKLIFIGPDGVLAAEATRDACEGWIAAPLAVEGWRVAEPG